MGGSQITLIDDVGDPHILSGDDICGGVGKVLQVKSLVVSTQGSQVISSVNTLVTGMSLSITSKGFDSKFIIEVRWFGETTTSWDTTFSIQQDGVSVNLLSGSLNGKGLSMPSVSYYTDNDSSTPETSNFFAVASTSSYIGKTYTYTLVVSCYNVTDTIWNNRCFVAPASGSEAGSSEIIITEVSTK